MLGKDFFGKAARLGEGARDLVGSMAGEVERLVKVRIEARFKKMNLVSREEFEALKTLAEKARAKVDALEQRLEEQQGKPPSKKKETQKETKKETQKETQKETKA